MKLRGVLLGALLVGTAATPAWAQDDSGLARSVQRALAARPQAAGADAGVRVTPGRARLGERLEYRAWVRVPPGREAHFQAPDSSDTFAWTGFRQGRAAVPLLPGSPPRLFDSVWVEAGVQLFATGEQRIPGLYVHVQGAQGMERGRLPSAAVTILPVLSAADSNANLRPVRGPLAAPWWERVPWPLVLAALVLLALLVWLVRWLRRRRPRPVSAPATPAPAMRRRPAIEEALAALAALRAERLPARGAFGEHALRLTRLLRVYLERSVGATLPGDTSSELLVHLRAGAVLPDDLDQLSGLLGMWDRVKFARAPLSQGEAERAEEAVDSFLRRHAGLPGREVA